MEDSEVALSDDHDEDFDDISFNNNDINDNQIINVKNRSLRTVNKILSSIRFECATKSEGYYADVDFQCQVFHYCKQNLLKFTFTCPTGSIFNQKELTCERSLNLDDPLQVCQQSENYYFINSIMYNKTDNQKISLTSNTMVTTETTATTTTTTTTSTTPRPHLNYNNHKKLQSNVQDLLSSANNRYSLIYSIYTTPRPALLKQIDKPNWFVPNLSPNNYLQTSSNINHKKKSFNRYNLNKYYPNDQPYSDKISTTTSTISSVLIGTTKNPPKSSSAQFETVQTKSSKINKDKTFTNKLNERINVSKQAAIYLNKNYHQKQNNNNENKRKNIDQTLTNGNNFFHRKPIELDEEDLTDDSHHMTFYSDPFRNIPYLPGVSAIVQLPVYSALSTMANTNSMKPIGTIKPRSKMDLFPLNLMRIKDKLLRRWNENGFFRGNKIIMTNKTSIDAILKPLMQVKKESNTMNKINKIYRRLISSFSR